MNKNLIAEYWLMIISWCLFLSGWGALAGIIATAVTAYMLLACHQTDLWRLLGVQSFMYLCVILLLNKAAIPYFFPETPYYMIAVCINAAVANEYLYDKKAGPILPAVIIILISLAVLTLIIIVLPDQWYTLFGKRDLFLMAGFIFLPYLIPLLVCLLYRTVNIDEEKVTL